MRGFVSYLLAIEDQCWTVLELEETLVQLEFGASSSVMELHWTGVIQVGEAYHCPADSVYRMLERLHESPQREKQVLN